MTPRLTHLHCGRHRLDLARPRVMGILNVTPDSFSDGGAFVDRERALDHARRMIADGADLIDIGGESTRPGAEPVAAVVELARVIPLVEQLSGEGVAVSVDTSKAEVMRVAIASGVAMINDVRALREEGALAAVVASEVAVCLMHMQGEPRSMQDNPQYGNVACEVQAFLAERARACATAGVARDRIVVDPGFGFGKTKEHNLALLRGLPALNELGYPILVGLSRKSMLKQLTGRPVHERLPASLAAALAAVARGAAIVRVHDVRATVDALDVWHAVSKAANQDQR